MLIRADQAQELYLEKMRVVAMATMIMWSFMGLQAQKSVTDSRTSALESEGSWITSLTSLNQGETPRERCPGDVHGEHVSAAGDESGKDAKETAPPAQRARYRLRRGITVDSGAANNVMPRRIVRNKLRIRPSKGSLTGVHYVAANNGRIPNEGEVDFEFMTNEGNKESMIFQIAEVNKALGSISYLVDHDYSVIFDKDEKTGKDLSMMTHKPTMRKTRFRREKNVWVLDAIIDEQADASFHRQG